MSQENVDLSRRLFELFNEREFDAFWSLIDEGVEWHSRADEPDADVYRGQESFRRYVDGWTETFPDVRLEFAGESVDLGDHVITPTHLVGTARATGIEVREPYSFLTKISEHKIVLCREFHNNAEALGAVGLVE
jgi:ketosteroid isomerase-like protein